MRHSALGCSVLLGVLIAPAVLSAATASCYHPDDAIHHLNKNLCISAHVYAVVELADGTRFLDVCRPETPDAQCRFLIVSLRQDRKDVGDLEQLRSRDIEIRGTVHSFNDQSGIILSHARQLHGGAEKFRPNPALMKGFAAEDGKAAFDDPAFKGGGHHHKSANPRN